MPTSDPVTNAIYDGIKRGIKVCLENKSYGSALILIYSGIDTMAFLKMPHNQINVKGDDFVKWCERYIKFPGQQQVTGLEFYSARCGMLHTYGVESNLTRNGKCRMLLYLDQCVPEIKYAPETEPDYILVSIDALATAFFTGIDRFLIDLFVETPCKETTEQRLKKLVSALPNEHIPE